MDDAQKQIVDSIRNNSNILVTVSTDPTVDELSAALGLAILLNDMDKRATALFSGAVPPAINFLEPDKTFENSADSLRDFIIALDKEKADHLRYKVDGDVVKIFITPYKTTLSQADLEFSQGDYNVQLVVAVGVKDQEHLDKSLEAHGKILHDATVVTITAGADGSKLGSVDWHDASASSLSEMVGLLIDQLKGNQTLLNEQISTALLTGIVSATDRFSNDRTSSRVMTMAAQLMAAGANQQLIAAKLEEAHDIAPGAVIGGSLAQSDGSSDGTELIIERDEKPTAPVKEKVIEPLPQQSKPQGSPEDLDQLELEKQLAGLTTPPSGTMEDIEKELQDAADQSVADAGPLTASSDTSMPGFEPTANVVLPEPPPVLEPAPEPEQIAEPPQIINEHGSMSSTPPQDTPPINSIQNDPTGGEETVDPFNMPAVPQEGTTITPNGSAGTAEGAAFLASEPIVQPAPVPTPVAIPTLSPAQAIEPGIPELPPLPPLPPNVSLPPLPPPPPPPPVFNQPSLGGPMPAGAVSGDVFGDSTVIPTPAAPAVAPEPGQFRIPGQ